MIWKLLQTGNNFFHLYLYVGLKYDPLGLLSLPPKLHVVLTCLWGNTYHRGQSTEMNNNTVKFEGFFHIQFQILWLHSRLVNSHHINSPGIVNVSLFPLQANQNQSSLRIMNQNCHPTKLSYCDKHNMTDQTCCCGGQKYVPLALPALIPSAISLCSFRLLGPVGRNWQGLAIWVLYEWHDDCGGHAQQQTIEAEKIICSMLSKIRFNTNKLDR